MIRTLLKMLAHKAIFPIAEFLNIEALKIASLLCRHKARELHFTGNDRVLVLAPHPDDETLGCGGTIALHLCAEDAVNVVVVTDGRRSRAGGLDPERMVELRTHEAQQAMNVLRRLSSSGEERLHLQQFQLPEGEWKDKELVARLGRLLDEVQPTIVYVTSYVDFHPEHLRVAHALAQTLFSSSSAANATVRVYELQVPLTQILVNVYSNVRASVAAKQEALAQYRTQMGSFLWVSRHSHYLSAIFDPGNPVEVFWEMGAAQYIALHKRPLSSIAFRSIRLRPFTDLAAWIVGSSKRRQYLKITNEMRAARE